MQTIYILEFKKIFCKIETSLKLLSQAQVVTGELIARLAVNLQTSSRFGRRWQHHQDDDDNRGQNRNCNLHLEKMKTNKKIIKDFSKELHFFIKKLACLGKSKNTLVPLIGIKQKQILL